jgi:hypothetical protein
MGWVRVRVRSAHTALAKAVLEVISVGIYRDLLECPSTVAIVSSVMRPVAGATSDG